MGRIYPVLSSIYRLNGVDIKPPSAFKIGRYNLTKSGRVTNGKMTMDLIAKKRKFYLLYKAISGTELDKILAIIDSTDMFFTFTYEENNVLKSAVVYSGEIETPKYRGRPGEEWYWNNVDIHLIEQ